MEVERQQYVLREFFIRGVVLLRGNKQMRGNNEDFAHLFMKLGKTPPPITLICLDGLLKLIITLPI